MVEILVNVTDIVTDPSTNIPNTPEQVMILLGVVFGIFLVISVGYGIYQMLK